MDRFAVIYGGGHTWMRSKRSGEATLALLQNLGVENASGVFIGDDGVWSQDGLVKDKLAILRGTDFVINCLHDSPTNNDALSLIEDIGIDFTGSPRIASNICGNKILSRKYITSLGARMPIAEPILSTDGRRGAEMNDDWFDRLGSYLYANAPFPAVVKPARGDLSVGISTIFAKQDYDSALRKAFAHDDSILVEEFIVGKHVSILVIENFRGEALYMTHDDHHGHVDLRSIESLYALSANMFFSLQLKDYAEFDFVIHERRGPYCLEINTHPELYHGSKLSATLGRVGASVKEFMHSLLRNACLS